MIRCFDLCRQFVGRPAALHGVNLELAEGSLTFLTGHSGAGKSTLLRLIAGIDTPSRGHISINDQNLNQLSAHELTLMRRNIGLIFQNPRLLYDRSIFDNVALPLIVSGCEPTQIRRRVHAALEKVKLFNKMHAMPQTLSSGEQQRVGIARAIVNKPMLLLADEPTGNLDPELSLEIMSIFQHFNQAKVTILIATHDHSLLARFPYPSITLAKGRLVKEATPS